jgi:hypothetical protein
MKRSERLNLRPSTPFGPRDGINEVGDGKGGTTTPFALGATELAGTNLVGSSSLRGGIAGGQIGFIEMLFRPHLGHI